MIKKYFNYLYMNAHSHNNENILKLFDKNPEAKILDLGCYDGAWTLKIGEKTGSKKLFGVEVLEKPAQQAKEKGISITMCDLNQTPWPFEDQFFDVIHSSFVIEHVFEVDRFLSEITRILKPGGYVITSTENGSSWHNIIASVLGWQTFTSACFSTKQLGIGNPLAIHRGVTDISPSMTHKVIFHYLGLKEFFQTYSYHKVKIVGAGYHPLPSFFGCLDVRHSHFITSKAFKGGEK